MDIYRFFRPHHNPRLLGTPLRQQEVGELEQAASELLRALKRAQLRTLRKEHDIPKPDHFSEPIQALQFVLNSLALMCDKHPGDSIDDLYDLISERTDSIGWSDWAELVREQIAFHGEQNYRKENPQSQDKPNLALEKKKNILAA